jgi:hypothetical protein
MGGQGDFVKQYSDTIFNSIKFKEISKNLETVSSTYDDFEIAMPSNYTFTNKKRAGNRFIQSYDTINNTYRFLKKVTLHDYNFIEEDTFELKQIHNRFYKDLKLKETYKIFNNNSLKSFAAMDTLTNKKLHLFAKLKGEEYYLLGMVTTDEANADAYFDSFKIKPSKYQEQFNTIKDTALFFSTVSSVKPPKFVINSNGYQKKDIKTYNAYNKKSVYQNKNNEAIAIQVNKSHDFLMFPSIDSVWTLRKKLYASKKFILKNEIITTSLEGNNVLQLTLTDTASTRGILIKMYLKVACCMK